KFTVKGITKGQGQGWMSDGEEAEGLSPIGHEIAYMKQRRGSANKGDKPTGGLGSLGAWPNKSKKDVDSAKVIYLGDIDFDAPGEATATDILVRQHRTRVRVKRVKDKGTTRKKRRTKPKRRIRSGKPLHPEEDEVEYILTIGMMLGLRVAVGRQANPLAKPELTVEDFYQARFLLQVDKYTFPPSGATGYLVTPSHKLGRTFKFKDYAPKVFKKIREHFGVDKHPHDARTVMASRIAIRKRYRDTRLLRLVDVAAMFAVAGRGFGSGSGGGGRQKRIICNGVKGGYRADVRACKQQSEEFKVTFVVAEHNDYDCSDEKVGKKAAALTGLASACQRGEQPEHEGMEGTNLKRSREQATDLESSETKFLRRILPHYYEHVKVHPETFLVRFYGMYRVKMHHLNKKVHFIVMNSVLDTYKEIHNTYDLKGSSLGRDAKPGEKVLKDNDLAERQGKLHLGSQRESFLKASLGDAEFLARMKIMDYSLLTGIHDRTAKPPDEEEKHQSPRRYSKFFNFADEADNKAIPGFKPAPVVLPGGPVPGTGPDPPPRTGGAHGRSDGDDGGGAGDGREASPGAKRGGEEGGASAGASAAGEGVGEELRLSPGVGLPRMEASQSLVLAGTFDSNQAELMFGNPTGGKNSPDTKRKTSMVALDSVAGAAAAGELYPASTEEDPIDIDIYSDEEAAGGGLWSATGTGTEGEDATDTGGDYTEGDAEYETPGEHNLEDTGELKRSLSRCSTAKGTLSNLPDSFLSSSQETTGAAAAAAAAAAGASGAPAAGGKGRRGRGGDGGESVSTRRVWTGKARKPVLRPRPEPRLAPPESAVSCAIKRRLDGGLDSEVGGKRGRDIYFMGIIDILQARQEYNARKHGETFLKSLAHDRAEISCVDPATYCQRFNDFLERHTD
ncbi:unnamed protein product, partial [Ectocarpus sp. 12 AP-2014]